MRIGQDAEPAERVDAVIHGEVRRRNGGAADAVEAVAAGDEVALERLLASGGAIGDPGRAGLEALDCHVLGFEDDRRVRLHPGGDQVPHHLVLAVDGDVLAGQRFEIDAVAHAAEEDLRAAMR